MQKKIKRFIKYLQTFIDRSWYAPLIGFLAALDNIVLIIPNDGILISSSILAPRKWFSFTLWVTIGSTLGAWLLILMIQAHGLNWLMYYFSGINTTTTWMMTENFFKQYGLYVVFLVALTPIAQQPAVILATLAQTPILELCLIIFLGRLIKFFIMSYVGSHAPKMLKHLFGLQNELEDLVSQPPLTVQNIHVEKRRENENEK